MVWGMFPGFTEQVPGPSLDRSWAGCPCPIELATVYPKKPLNPETLNSDLIRVCHHFPAEGGLWKIKVFFCGPLCVKSAM